MTTDPTELRTERLVLRRVTDADVPAAIRIMGDPETNRYNPAGAPTPEEATAQVAEWQEHWRRDGIGYWSVTLRTTGDQVGFGGLRHHVQDGEQTLNLFYRFTPIHWGKGYAPEMAAAAIAWADTNTPDRPVVIITDVDNKPSQRVAEKLGFVHTADSITIDGPVLVWRRLSGGEPR
ncbi:GNAT family N-acetyltransferase [Saccharothrix violaceirubra]|uniref:RimJ/RimL family protein N-acetyltransferase n=1 Tax=Saccharothrix violaceirubra TaxID=413306 RepID=A0A7W7SZ44_9PSEU|nr:GNAT family N-acetyltransferase [Saccharothrix violaceirubra]MBB4963621.1 RimJ/RimL family protein N-acetyltransferase [Saccharothrix violaceirubra]